MLLMCFQLAIIASMESSEYYKCLDDSNFMSRFDVHMTYHRASEVPLLYWNPRSGPLNPYHKYPSQALTCIQPLQCLPTIQMTKCRMADLQILWLLDCGPFRMMKGLAERVTEQGPDHKPY